MVAQPLEDVNGHGLLHLGSEEDRELTLAFQRGDEGAYQAIYDRYHPRVHGVCRRMLVNPDDAAEASQEALLRVYQALGRFNGRYQLGAWITRVTTNVCLDHLRARTRRGGDLAAIELSEIDASAPVDETPEAVTVRRAESRRVRAVIASLPPMHRAAIVLRDFEGFSYEEIALTLDISPQQVKALLHRARQRFKRDWAGSLAAFLPWRWVQRWRDDGVVRDSSVMPSVGQMAPTTSNLLQTGGQYVMEKLAPVVTAAVVASTAMAPGAPAALPHPAEDDVVAARESEVAAPSAPRKRAPEHKKETRSRVVEVAAGPVAPESAAPVATPTPTPTPTPAEDPGQGEGSGQSGGDEGETSGPSPSPSPQPFAPAIGFDWGTPVSQLQPTARSEAVSCAPLSIYQKLSTAVDDDDAPVRHPAVLELDARDVPGQGKGISLTFTVTKNDTQVVYSGFGLIMAESVDRELVTVTYLGDYSTSNRAAAAMDLPQNGRFDATLTLDCASRSVITESVIFRR